MLLEASVAFDRAVEGENQLKLVEVRSEREHGVQDGKSQPFLALASREGVVL